MPATREAAQTPSMRDRPLDLILAQPTARLDRRSAGTAARAASRDGTAIDELAAASIAGDVASLGRLYDELVGPIYRYVAVRVHSREDAEDITQLVFERIVGSLPRYRPNGRPFAAWAFRIARNAVIDHVRRERPTEPLTPANEQAAEHEVEAISLRGEQIRELRQAMRRLTPDQREALTLRFVAGLSAEEAAQVMGRRAGTIRGLTFRAIGSLRRLMATEPAEQETGA